ncbi:2-phosphosulfolactate phosphatase [Amycolatopsis thermophila]|uniref:Probable 2-phosphosulfolactate phosphatase n=1 Tax=Amycolatopsis thermophila TaxID=206084 RepID=A0ABU0EMZ2_9PSEU|nr:2-phosphosulfolactate phosphatase [Amycolatopsis thermophila]MDQ0376649.1 2-phosphosulfolactate phosphatase [Amycolatopsis thermophila]
MVDVLPFSTTVDLVTSRGGRVRPLHWQGDAAPRPAAVAAAADRIAGPEPIGVIPAGERWGITITTAAQSGSLRPCVEDLLGAGAIAAALSGRSASPEALLAATAYHGTDIRRALRGCSSGRELIAAGHQRDVELAAEVDVSPTAPILVDDLLEAA